jgi:hypothetical protein
LPWEVVYTEEAADWLVNTLSQDDYERMMAAIEMLEEYGPALGRPLVDHIKSSRHQNMKELRSGTARALFIFDPIRRAVVLVGGDKRDEWTSWYDRNIPAADDLYDTYLKEEL